MMAQRNGLQQDDGDDDVLEIAPSSQQALVQIVGVGGLSVLAFILGFLMFSIGERYPLVERPEQMWMGHPARWSTGALVFTGFTMACLVLLALAMRWKLPMGLLVASLISNGAVGWLVIIVVGAMGISSCILGLAYIINGSCDRSPAQRHLTTVLDKRSPSRQKPYLRLTDWRSPSQTVNLDVDNQAFAARTVGEVVPISTKSGFLGYEWISEF